MRKLLNLTQISKVKSVIILLILFSLYIFICANSYVQAVSSDISNNVFRLHVIANSNCSEDQALNIKLEMHY